MPSRFQEMLKTRRENEETSRVGLKWDDGEDDQMLSLIRAGTSREDVAGVLHRTPGSIKTRLIITALNKMNDDQLSLDQAAQYVCLDEKDITEYLEKKEQRINKRQTEKTRRGDTPNIRLLTDMVYELKRRVDYLEKR